MAEDKSTTGVQEESLSSYGYKQEFKRVLKLRHLISYGLAYVTPTAPFPMLGIVAIATAGHLATTYVVAFVALFFTATSYAKMAYRHPIAGSAYSYSQRAIHPHVGFVIGWALFMSYLLVPLLSVLAARDLCQQIIPSVPGWVWVWGFVLFMTLINFYGIRVTATANTVMNVAMILAAILFVVLGLVALSNGVGEGVILSTKPFYEPGSFSSTMILTGASIAVFSYIGFDGVSTLAEEVENPRINIGRATIIVAVLCAVIFVVVAYISQLVWPNYGELPNDVGAVLLISERMGGGIFRLFIFAIMIVAGVSCALASQTSAARLMYGMGRDSVLPRKFFSYVSPTHQIPTYNLLLIAVVTLVCAFTFERFQTAAEVLNYGAFLGFFAVNLSVIFEYLINPIIKKNEQGKELIEVLQAVRFPLAGILLCLIIFNFIEILTIKILMIILTLIFSGRYLLSTNKFKNLEEYLWRYLLMPLLGMSVIGIIFYNLNRAVIKYVSYWMVGGLIYYGIITKGFRKTLKMKIE